MVLRCQRNVVQDETCHLVRELASLLLDVGAVAEIRGDLAIGGDFAAVVIALGLRGLLLVLGKGILKKKVLKNVAKYYSKRLLWWAEVAEFGRLPPGFCFGW